MFVIDTNLLKNITRVDRSHLYKRCHEVLVFKRLIDENTIFVMTVGGVVEYLGKTIPILHPRNESDLIERANKIAENGNRNFIEIQKLRARLIVDYEEQLRTSLEYSKRSFSIAVGLERNYVDHELHDFVLGLIWDNVRSLDSRELIINRIAIDRMLSYRWPSKFMDLVYSAMMVDIHQAVGNQLAFGSMRGVELLWKNFSQVLRARNRQFDRDSNPNAGHENRLSAVDLDHNINEASTAASFAATGDFLDVEAIHDLVIGKFRNGAAEPIIFATQDPFKKQIVRIGMFKSIYINAHQMITKKDLEIPPMAEGAVAFFDRDANLTHIIKVSNIPPLFPILESKRLATWLGELELKFRCN